MNQLKKMMDTHGDTEEEIVAKAVRNPSGVKLISFPQTGIPQNAVRTRLYSTWQDNFY